MRHADIDKIKLADFLAFGHKQLIITKQLALETSDNFLDELGRRVEIRDEVIEEELVPLSYSR